MRGVIFFTRNPEQSYPLGYEPAVTNAISALMSPNKAFYDIGANEGWFSVLVGRKAPDAAIYAFEPDPDNCIVIRRNIEQNRTQHVHIIPSCVGDVSGTVQFASYANCGLVNHVITPSLPAANDANISEVAAITIDGFVAAGNPPPALIKIDVEGYEENVIRGAAETLATHKPTVICEVRTTNWDWLSRVFEQHGYRHRILSGHARGFDVFGLNDVVFYPPGRGATGS